MADPAAWNQYGDWSYIVIVSLGFGVAAVVTAIWWLEASRHIPAALAKQADDSTLWFERWAGAVVHWGGEMGFETLPRLRASWLALADRLLQIDTWHNVLDATEHSMQHWILAVTLLLLLGIVIALLSM